jgi:hypothetical protein
LAYQYFVLGKKADLIDHLRIVLASNIEGLNIRVAAVVNEPSLVSVEHGVQAQGEEL